MADSANNGIAFRHLSVGCRPGHEEDISKSNLNA